MDPAVKSELQHLKSEEEETEMQELGWFSYTIVKLAFVFVRVFCALNKMSLNEEIIYTLLSLLS